MKDGSGDSKPVPVTLLTGFLGAGKTTLLNRILRKDHGRRVAAVVNDIGEIEVDARLVRSVHGKVMSLWNGCICCDAEADLRLTLLTLLSIDEPPEQIVVEASGVADPLATAATFRGAELRDRVRLDSVVALVDAEHAMDPRLDPQLVRDQVALADIVVLNKVDLVDEDRLRGLRDWISSIVPSPRVLEAIRAELPLDLIMGINPANEAVPGEIAGGTARGGHGTSRSLRSRGGEPGARDVAAAHAHAGYETWTYRSRVPLRLHESVEALKRLPEAVIRVKGVVWLEDAPGVRLAVNLVGRRISTEVLGRWEHESPSSHLVLIGRAGGTSQAEIEGLLDSAATPLRGTR